MTNLLCYRCGATASFPDRKRCDCGEPLWFDTEEAAAEFAWPDSEAAAEKGVWRYADLLPLDPESSGIVEGVSAAQLDADLRCRLWLKDESENPTGSFKDRGSAVGVAWAADAGREWVGTVSHGNMAMSVAANAAGIAGNTGDSGRESEGSREKDGGREKEGDGLEALVLVPDDISV